MHKRELSNWDLLILYFNSLKRWFFTRTHTSGMLFENRKSSVIGLLLWKRGKYGRYAVHLGVFMLILVSIVSSGIVGNAQIVSGSYPGIPVNPLVSAASQDEVEVQAVAEQLSPVTIISEKPRDKVIEHEVLSGETLSKIAEKYGVSVETIKWENNILSDSALKTGTKVRILPVSGIAHKIKEGDTIYSVAKKYKAEAQAVLDFPFNNIGDNLALSIGDTLIVPDGTPVEAPKSRPTQYLASKDANLPPITGGGQFAMPTTGGFSQYYSWYHPGIDIANRASPQVQASDGGKVIVAGFVDSSGYGNRVIIDHGNGYQTLYAHLSANYVAVGQNVAKGQVIGQMGSTGRSTGTHLHFEIRNNGRQLNPLSFVK